MTSDLKYTFRQIVKFPGYTVVVVLTLAFGIAVNTQIFGLVSSQFLQPLAVRDPNRLQVIVERSDLFNLPHSLSFPDFQDIRAGSKSMTNFSASFFTAAHLSIQGKSPERTWVEAVTPDAFGKYGITTLLGRPLQTSDGETPPGVPVAVLTYRTWQNRFGSDPGVIGRAIQINAKPFTVVGVLQPGFESFSYDISASLFIPSGSFSQIHSSGDAFFKYRGAKAWRVLAYRQPGTTVAQTNTELALFAERFARDFPSDHRNARFQAAPEKNSRPDPSLIDFMPALISLFSGLVILVLLIACANVANLMGAHALEREKEFVVRSALGASRGRIIRQLLVESLVLTALAGITGYLLAEWSSGLLDQFVPKGDLPIRVAEPASGGMLVFTVAISLIAGLASGLMPALRASRVNLNESLKQGGRQISGKRHRLRNLLVIGQVAVSCVVLIAAALFVRGLHAATDLNLGFRPERLLMVSTDVGLQGYDQERGLRFEKQLLDDVRALPGVESATFTQHVPFSSSIKITNVFPDGSTASLTDNQIAVSHSAVAPGYIATMGVPLLRGRDLQESDGAKSPLVAVINEAMAKKIWPGKDAIGQHFHLDWNGSPAIEVVGIVSTGKYLMLSEEARPYFYLPFAQRYGMPATLIVRALGNPASLTNEVRNVVHHLDPDLPVYDLLTFDDHLAQSIMALMPLRMGATIAGVQGLLALLLAVLGLYAVVSFGVTNRTREIGVRMALGANTKNVLQLVASEGLRLTLIGIGIGLVFAVAVAFGLSRVVFGVSAFDPVALAGVVLVLIATSALACWLPARRATRVDPMVSLRAE